MGRGGKNDKDIPRKPNGSNQNTSQKNKTNSKKKKKNALEEVWEQKSRLSAEPKVTLELSALERKVSNFSKYFNKNVKTL